MPTTNANMTRPSLPPQTETNQPVLEPPSNLTRDYAQTHTHVIQEHSDELIKAENETEEEPGFFDSIMSDTLEAPDDAMEGSNDDGKSLSEPLSSAFSSPRLRKELEETVELEETLELPSSLPLEHPTIAFGVVDNSNEENDDDEMEASTGGTEELRSQIASELMDTDSKEEQAEPVILSEEVPAEAEPPNESQSTAVDISTTGPAETEPNTETIKDPDDPKPIAEQTSLSFSHFRKDSLMRPIGVTYEHGRGSLPPPQNPISSSLVTAVENPPTRKRSASEDLLLPRSTQRGVNDDVWMKIALPSDVKRQKLTPSDLDNEQNCPSPDAIDQTADQSSGAASKRHSVEVIDLEEFEQDRNDRLAQQAQEKQAKEEEEAARLAQEAEEIRQQELQMYTNNFLASFQSGGISTDETENPQEAKYAAVTSEGLAAVLQFVQQVQREAKEDVTMLRVDNEMLRGELQKSKEAEAKLAEEIKELTDSRSQKMWKNKMKAERERMEADLSRVEEKLDLLRAPDVTLEEMESKIDGFDEHMSKKMASFDKKFATMKAEAEKLNAACEAEKKLLNTARRDLTRDFRNRKDETERLDGDMQAMESNVEELSNRIRDLEASADQAQHPSRCSSTTSELPEVVDDIAQLRAELEETDERLDVMQNDIVVFRNHVTEHLFDKDCLYTQAELNRIFFTGISDLKFHYVDLRRQLVASVAEMRSAGRPANSYLITLVNNGNGPQSQERHVMSLNPRLLAVNNEAELGTLSDSKSASTAIPETMDNKSPHYHASNDGIIRKIQAQSAAISKIDSQIKFLKSKQTELDEDMDRFHERLEAQSPLLADVQDQQSTDDNTDLETRISTLMNPIKNVVDGLVEALRLLGNKLEIVQTESREADQALDAKIIAEKIERIQGDLKEKVTRTTAVALCSRNFNGLWDLAQNISTRAPIENDRLAKEEEKCCGVSTNPHSPLLIPTLRDEVYFDETLSNRD